LKRLKLPQVDSQVLTSLINSDTENYIDFLNSTFDLNLYICQIIAGIVKDDKDITLEGLKLIVEEFRLNSEMENAIKSLMENAVYPSQSSHRKLKSTVYIICKIIIEENFDD
jgi:hypothetical protein